MTPVETPVVDLDALVPAHVLGPRCTGEDVVWLHHTDRAIALLEDAVLELMAAGDWTNFAIAEQIKTLQSRRESAMTMWHRGQATDGYPNGVPVF